MKPDNHVRGLVLCLTGSLFFGAIPPYVTLLRPLSTLDIMAWRNVWTLPVALLFVALRGRTRFLLGLVSQCLSRPSVGCRLLMCASSMAAQQWVFLWAPLHGRMLEVSLGFFLLPIVMVLVGFLVDRHPVHRSQWLAVACASVGVFHEMIVNTSISWPTLVIAFGFPPYYLIRRRIHADSMSVFCMETALLIPVSAIVIAVGDSMAVLNGRPDLWAVLLPGLGVIATVALTTHLSASRLLPIGLFGLLGYVEPLILLLVSLLVLKEELSLARLLTFVPMAFSALLAMATALTPIGRRKS